jgi:hypothetical protein
MAHLPAANDVPEWDERAAGFAGASGGGVSIITGAKACRASSARKSTYGLARGGRRVPRCGRGRASDSASWAESGIVRHAHGPALFSRTSAMESALLDRVRVAIGAAGLWERIDKHMALPHCELMPWSGKGAGC